jgi:tetratricopeptide (TPR) repeat protein
MKRLSAGLLAIMLATAAAAQEDQVREALEGAIRFPASEAGAYLAGREAFQDNDFAAAAVYLGQSLRGDPENPMLLESLIASQAAMGDFTSARPVAEHMFNLEMRSQIAALAHAVALAQTGDWDALLADQADGVSIGPAADQLGLAWARFGKGEVTEALAALDGMIAEGSYGAFALFAKSLMLGAVGDFEGAAAILGLPPDQGLRPTPRVISAYAQVLSQLDRNADAIAAINAAYPGTREPTTAALRARLEAGETLPWTMVNDATEGMAEAFFMLATARDSGGDELSTLLFARSAVALDPGHTDAILLAGQMLEALGQYDLAGATYATVDPADPAFVVAEQGRAEVMRRAGSPDAAVEILQALARSNPDLAPVHAALGDTLRIMRRYPEAREAYGRALELYPAGDPAIWFIHYVRGIANYHADDWPAAEADFRASLALEPDKPAVLNFLGYSLVERQERLDEALAMIERAVALDSQNGAIVDSLGWALFRLGRYQDAVMHMEAAASLLPTDPVINDHLGDVYWAVGRHREAQFQWSRALSFNPEPEEAQRIQRKLAVGLDAVLAEEGAPSLQAVAEGSGG